MKPQRNLALFGVVILYSLPLYARSVKCFFSSDDFFNLYLYNFQSFEKLLIGNFAFWNTTYRPLGGILYSILFHFAGLEPLPYHIVGNFLRIVNLGLLLFLLLRITQNPLLATFVTAASSIHWETSNAIYNFGAVYELLAFCFFLISFHFYISYKQTKKPLLYVVALLSYILALNGKEMAVTLPIIILVYEIIYRGADTSLSKFFVQLLPFIVVGGVFSIGKYYGVNSYLSDPTYLYRFDYEVLKNLNSYLEMLSYGRVHLSVPEMIFMLLAALVIAILLRNKNMLFGLFYFLITLLPVIGLRKVWGLYLYIPMMGIVLCATSFFGELIRRIIPALKKSPFPYLGVILTLALLILIQYPKLIAATEKHYIQPGNERRKFVQELLSMYPTIPSNVLLAFKNPPFVGTGVHHCVWVTYKNPAIQVFRLPEQQNTFLQLSKKSESRALEYKNSKLVEIHFLPR